MPILESGKLYIDVLGTIIGPLTMHSRGWFYCPRTELSFTSRGASIFTSEIARDIVAEYEESPPSGGVAIAPEGGAMSNTVRGQPGTDLAAEVIRLKEIESKYLALVSPFLEYETWQVLLKFGCGGDYSTVDAALDSARLNDETIGLLKRECWRYPDGRTEFRLFVQHIDHEEDEE